MATSPINPTSASAVVSNVTTNVETGEKVISSWHVNGWLLVGAIILANVVGALFHV